jgi:hypothetical protein
MGKIHRTKSSKAMKRIIIKEAALVLIAASVFGLLSLTTKTAEPIIIGLLVYSGIRISYWYGMNQNAKQ